MGVILLKMRRTKNDVLPNSKDCELNAGIVKKACVELIDLKRIEDAMILKTIYSLSMNPASLVLLTYESISFKGVLKYWDDKSMSFEEFQLSKEMIQDFKYFKNYSIQKDKLSIVNSKVSHNGKIIKGTFIFNLSATNIFNRFKRKFGGKLSWFKWSPKDVELLGKS